MSGIENVRPLPCTCGGFWPDDHVVGCTHQEMAKLWPKSYRKELEQSEKRSVPTSADQPSGDE